MEQKKVRKNVMTENSVKTGQTAQQIAVSVRMNVMYKYGTGATSFANWNPFVEMGLSKVRQMVKNATMGTPRMAMGVVPIVGWKPIAAMA